MTRYLASISVLLAAATLGTGCSRTVSFSAEVYPILEKNCLGCHKKDEKGEAASGFNMETYYSFMKGTKHGPVVEPGSGSSSVLSILIEHRADSSINMPRGRHALSEEDTDTIRLWIDQGALNN